LKFDSRAISSTWLTVSRLARKSNRTTYAYDAVMRATDLEDPAAIIEHSRLLWKSGHHRKAIQNLRSALSDGKFAVQAHNGLLADTVNLSTTSLSKKSPQNVLLAKTQLLLAKWMDISGQEKSADVLIYYKESTEIYNKWDKGHYFLGSYYNKILESEKSAPQNRQTEAYLTGECAKLTIDNYLRSMIFGPKYIYRTLPKVLTLWLDFGQDMHQRTVEAQQLKNRRDKKYMNGVEAQYMPLRQRTLDAINIQIEKYLLKRTPTFVAYTAFAQILSRINNPQRNVQEVLRQLIVHITSSHPQQALWSLFAVARSSVAEKSTPAKAVIAQVRKMTVDGVDLRNLVCQAEDLTENLLNVCKAPVEAKGFVSLSKDLRFTRRLDEACGLVIPFTSSLTVTFPSNSGVAVMRKHNPFPNESITIAGFQDDVMVLSSLQKPRKLIMIGTDGVRYPILCKPKDDLRKDQRLMEFNAVIDRALKRDVEAAKRKLYIRTYAVTTLNDEHGVLEWVDGLKPLRDIIVPLLGRQGNRLNFGDVRALLDKACADKQNAGRIFSEKLLPSYPPVLYKWFLESFLEPERWFEARLRYTRSCAVMSIVGHALGLGDRHGENLSLELGSGGVFHVDFNCLFEKGLTFDKPELVPFRLTHNMVDAFGVYGYEGPFRRSAEITQRILKQYEDTLMTIMETFIYDPTTDFGVGERRRRVAGVPETPTEVLTNVKSKFNCMLRGETVPLSIEGYVDALIRMAVDPKNLVHMYVGWCAFL
jgi:serine/threonine-protein kinase ATR